ncbi:biotin transporter BioY [Rummeliibacillus suwonensis]|mgnify:FL=1|jgi:biotin transport system substrate-specific component|uniref:biotin transporter BioY n=1 Tax=Rummeliibacillus suwonensis TaxID=1306154 RepID=UPI0011B855FA|nr:biotin transporter BioY [Rummeliibacillus suwonensis]MBO2537619.1 biotin transporter BioY [Rummeliibacillus suwonensis]
MTSNVSRTKSKFSTLDIVYCGLFATLMMIGANITSFAPFLVVGGVPITLQPLFAILAGLVLGSRLGAVSITVYTLLGLVGAPVFAKFSGGFSSILSPTFGFIVTFILSAYVAGKMVEYRRTKTMYITAALVGIAINYLIGTNWMYYAYKLWAAAPEGFTYKMAWLWMIPPLPKDIILAVFAGIFGYRLQKIIKVGH